MTQAIARLRAAGSAIAGWLDVRDLMYLTGLGLVAAGAYQVYPPAGLIVPGLILLFGSAPTRPPFFMKPRPPKGDN